MQKSAKTPLYSTYNNDKNTMQKSNIFIEDKLTPRKRIERLKDKESKTKRHITNKKAKISQDREHTVIAFKKL